MVERLFSESFFQKQFQLFTRNKLTNIHIGEEDNVKLRNYKVGKCYLTDNGWFKSTVEQLNVVTSQKRKCERAKLVKR